MSGSARVRTATPLDAELLARIRIASWRAAYRGRLPDSVLDALDLATETERFRSRLEPPQPPNTFVLVEVDGRGSIRGYLLGGPYREDDGVPAPGTGEVYAVYVDPASWGGGAGSALLAQAELRLAASGFTTVALWVLESNEAARGFYEARGWVLDGGNGHCAEAVGAQEVRYRRGLVGAPPTSG